MHLASAQQVQVQVADGLATFRASADHNTVAFAEPVLAGDLRGRGEQTAEESFIARLGIGERGEVFLRDHEDVLRRLRVDVVEGIDRLVFVGLLRGNLAGDDFAEEAVHSDFPGQKWK